MNDLQQNLKLLDALAASQHEIWAHWMKYLFSLCAYTETGEAIIPADKVQRWQRQMGTTYAELSQAEQKSDLDQAAKIVAALRSTFEVQP